jgi:diguanylate cyclase (GGDEF)-like protein/PAS domain S-box-containing protein
MTEQRIAKLNMCAVVASGVAICLHAAYNLPIRRAGLPFVLLALITIGVASHINIKIPSFKSNVSISDIFVFLSMLLFGSEAAVLVAATEAAVSSLRISKTPLTIAFNSAAMACSTFATVAVLQLCFGSITNLPHADVSVLVSASCAMALVQYLANSTIVAIAGALRAEKPIWDTWKKYYLWMAVSYFSAALAAGLIGKLVMRGPYSFLAMVPIIAVVYFTYRTYIRNLQASVAHREQVERHLTELRRSEGRFRNAFDHAPIGMALVAPDGRWLMVNHSFCEIVGYSEQELLGAKFPIITHPDDLDRFLQQVSEVLEGTTPTNQIEKRYIDKEGDEIWATVSISILPAAQNELPHLIFQIQDISDRKRAEERLLHDAFHDALTGLPNRAFFVEQLQIALNGARRRPDRMFAVLFLDLDRFKIINDSIGHMCGDQLLIGIARRLRACLRPEDLIARLGGDEFTILLNDLTSVKDAIGVAERIQKQVSRSFNLSGYETFTTGSIGIALSNSSYDRPEDLLRDADTAMYQAKALGKAQHVIFDVAMHTRALNTLQLETDLRRAMDRKEFFLQYQPIVSLSTGTLSGFEALVRWRHPERGMIPPADFISVAEETGLIVPIGQWVLSEACSQLRSWQLQAVSDAPLSISVNLSSKQFAHPGLLEQIIQILVMTGLDPRALKLEITESVVMENVEAAAGMLERLRALGVELSIDDFGTGYSSLSYLHRLPIDTLKIDRSFVGRIEESDNKEIVRTIVTLARTLGKGVVAEGVETREQLSLLRELNCDSAQGYLFSRPVDPDVALGLIRNMSQWLSTDLFRDKADEAFDTLASAYSM